MQDFVAEIPSAVAITPAQTTKPTRFRTLRVVSALILRETGSRDTRNSLGFLWNLIDPIISIILLSIVFGIILRSPRLGTNFPLYYITGVVPYHLYSSISGRVATSMRFSSNLLSFPTVTVIDIIAARTLLNAITNILVFVLLVAYVDVAYNLQLRPEMGAVLTSLAMAIAFGLGVGTLNSVLFLASPTYESLWNIINRPLVLFSGVMFRIEELPPEMFNVLKWLPQAQMVAQMRGGFYPFYQIGWVHPSYVFAMSAVTFMLGLIGLHRYVFDVLED